MKMQWMRRLADSSRNFDLVLQNPGDLDGARTQILLERIVSETHRRLTLNNRAIAEFRRFFDHPNTALKSEAYVLLSNWFMTRSGDRNSMVATRCEALWDELFPCRPVERLSSPAAGKNHIILAPEFQTFWSRILKAQGKDHDCSGNDEVVPEAGIVSVQSATSPMMESTAMLSAANDGSPHRTVAQRPLTIAEAKAALALSFGVPADKVEITIRG